jgi:hypothetical protein
VTGPAAGGGRHAPAAIVEAYQSQGVNGVLVVGGTPAARIEIAPQHRRLSLLVQVSGEPRGPDLLDRANLAYDVVHDAGQMWHRLDVTFDDNLGEVYPVLCAVADRIQLGGESFTDAVEAVLAGLGDILAGRGGLPHEKQVGLFGELVVLLSLAAHSTPAGAVAAWRGPDREEHDFGLPGVDVEVKTTMSEHRRHWIGAPTQLVPTPDRDLHLLSLQITASGAGPGATLTDLVGAAQALPGAPPGAVEAGLASAGWRARHADLYRSRWTLRTAAEFHLVDDAFPAVTPDRLGAAVPSPERIVDFRYRVDLDRLVPAAALFPVTIPTATKA